MIITGLLAMATPALADSCSGAGNVVQNCNFASGSYSATVNGATSSNVPLNWTPNYGFVMQPAYNRAATGGTSAIGNYDYQTVPSLTQTLTDVAGASYTGTLSIDYGGAGDGDSGAFFLVLIDGNPVASLNDTAPGS